MKHTHLDRWTCTSGKWMIPRHELSPRYQIAHGWKIWVWICHQGIWELMKQKEPRSISILLLLIHFLLIFSLSFFFSLFSLFSYFSFSSHHNFFIFHFFFCSSELLQHNTYIAFVIYDVMTPPMLERCSSSSAKPQIFIENPNPCTIAIVPGSVAIAYRTSPDYTKSYIASHISNST
jgi:hypothetical protein